MSNEFKISESISEYLGMQTSVGTPKQLFYTPDMMWGYGADWFRRKLSTQDIATLMHVHPTTVHKWRVKGWLKGNKTGTRKGWRKLVYWRHSLKDLEDCLLKMTTRKRRDGLDIEHTTWTRQEIADVLAGKQPEGRSRAACRTMRCRLRKLQ